MKLHRLRLQNFRQHVRTDIDFDAGITGIIGPNGSGKTTLLEAIAWALYGNQAVRGTRDSIRYIGAGARAAVEVELTFELGGHSYRVTRGLTTAAVYLDGADNAIANSITGVNDLLQRRLGMTRTEFFNTYFTGQKELSVMAAMGPTERAQFLSRVLGYERLRTAQELLRERRRMIGAEIAGLRSGMPEATTIEREVQESQSRVALCVAQSNKSGSEHAAALTELQKVTPVWDAMQHLRERWQRLSTDVTITEQEGTALARERDRLANELADIRGAQTELESLQQAIAPLAPLRAELAQLDDLFRQQDRRRTIAESERLLGDELLQLRDRLAKREGAPALEAELVQTLERQRAEHTRVQTELEAARTDWVRDRQEAETKLQELRRQYADVKTQKERVTALGADGACPTCNRVLGENYASVVEQLNEQLATLQIDGQYYRVRGEQLERAPDAIGQLDEQRKALETEIVQLERRLAKVQIAVQELPVITQEIAAKEARRLDLQREMAGIPAAYDAARHAHVRDEVARLAPMETRAARLGAAVERVAQIVEQHQRLVNEHGVMAARLEALRTEIQSLQFSERDYTAARDDFERATMTARATELAVVTAQGEVRAAQLTLDTALEKKQEYARNAAALAVLQTDRLTHDELDRAYTDLRTDLNFQLRPELSELASEFLRELTDDRYSQIELDDQYNIIILEDGIPKPVISGGEEDLANLVLRLAISQMIAERAGQAFSLLVLDEVFGSLDASRRDNVIDLLRKLQDRFEQVILITHIETVRDGVDRVIAVRYDQEAAASVTEMGEGGGGEELLLAGAGAGMDTGDTSVEAM